MSGRFQGSMEHWNVDVAATRTNETVKDPAAGQKLEVWGWSLSCAADATCILSKGDNSAGNNFEESNLFIAGPPHRVMLPFPIVLDDDIVIAITTTGAGGTIEGTIYGREST